MMTKYSAFLFLFYLINKAFTTTLANCMLFPLLLNVTIVEFYYCLSFTFFTTAFVANELHVCGKILKCYLDVWTRTTLMDNRRGRARERRR